ncbi:MAG: dienelactone hydrolase family protein, partial [Cyanobacteria bacterium REEB65]|nr:dienelactone hydrolase family protein [Cyanobacteria bacterium REEB65]
MRPVRIEEGQVALSGDLDVPPRASGIVVFAHGSGSSRLSPRNRFVAECLQRSGIATLLMDLLTPEEEEAERFTRHLRFDIPLLSRRLARALEWLELQPDVRELPIGLFGASTGAAAALLAAARFPGQVRAVVSRGGRPDLAGDALAKVEAPTLLIVGGADEGVIGLNQQASQQMRCSRKIVLIPGATHLFEEPGTLEEVARLAAQWFVEHLRLRAEPMTGLGQVLPGDPPVCFKNREDAGKRLAGRLSSYQEQPCVVLGLPRGGVPVAAEIARALAAPLDVVVARKIGYPGNPELAIAAVTARGTRVLHDDLLRGTFIRPGYLDEATQEM